MHLDSDFFTTVNKEWKGVDLCLRNTHELFMDLNIYISLWTSPECYGLSIKIRKDSIKKYKIKIKNPIKREKHYFCDDTINLVEGQHYVYDKMINVDELVVEANEMIEDFKKNIDNYFERGKFPKKLSCSINHLKANIKSRYIFKNY